GHALGAIEGGAIWRGPWTAPSSPGPRETDLTGFEEGHRMNLVSRKRPRDAVACVNPELIGQKRQRLNALVSALGARDRLPDGGVHHLGGGHSCHEHQTPDDAWKPGRSEVVHQSSLLAPFALHVSHPCSRDAREPPGPRERFRRA